MNALAHPLTALMLVALMTAAGRAQQSPQIEPDAMEALTRMGGYLRMLKAFQVDAATTTEDVLEDGQKVQFGGNTSILALPPSCSAVIVNGFTYQQCGTVWYQPQIAGGSTTYVVVNAPR